MRYITLEICQECHCPVEPGGLCSYGCKWDGDCLTVGRPFYKQHYLEANDVFTFIEKNYPDIAKQLQHEVPPCFSEKVE